MENTMLIRLRKDQVTHCSKSFLHAWNMGTAGKERRNKA